MLLLHAVSVILCMQYFIVQTLVTGETAVYRLGVNVELTCTSSSDADTYVWRDTSVTPVITIYLVSDANEQDKREAAKNDQKYENFGLRNLYPDSANLIIQSVELEDEGTYECGLADNPSNNVLHEVHVEATPISVNVSCTRNRAKCPQTVGTSDDFICTCEAVGAFPDTLELSWSNVEGDPTTDPPTDSTQRPGAYNYISTATFIPTETRKTATCTVGGYIGSWDVEEDDYPTAPPVCQVETSCNGNNTIVNLTCNCNGAIPSDGLSYSFFQDDVLIPSGGTENSVEVSIESDTDYVFGCRQCNGVNYGQESYSSVDAFCTDATTVTTPATSTGKEGNPTGKPDSQVALIVALSVGIPIVIIILAIVIWYLKKRGGGHTKHTSDLPNDDASNAMPLYGEVKKDRKKKRDKPDGNGAGPESDMPTYADVNKPTQPAAAPRTSQKVPDDQPMQELQYADLDHGKKPPTNEIRKPQDEPTEYATVQSVIV